MAVVMPARMKRALVSRDRNIFAGLKTGWFGKSERENDGQQLAAAAPMRPIIPVGSLTRRVAIRGATFAPVKILFTDRILGISNSIQRLGIRRALSRPRPRQNSTEAGTRLMPDARSGPAR